MRVGDGRVVSLQYMVRLGNGQVVETSLGKDPIEYLHGGGQILPALERALEGLREGEQAAFSIPCEDAYGERKEDNVVTLPRALFPADVELKPGLCLYARASGGQSYPITVREVRDSDVLVDLNHPLAGERLYFEVTIRAVRTAGSEEIFAGKPHEIEVV
jgi:FKBP-type peptidyl-prolyl cis-trans isomerase SlyD